MVPFYSPNNRQFQRSSPTMFCLIFNIKKCLTILPFNKLGIFIIFAFDLQGKRVKMNTLSAIIKSLPTTIAHLVNYTL